MLPNAPYARKHFSRIALIVALLIVIVVVLLYTFFSPPGITFTEERITLPVNQKILTTHEYSGWVWVIISGRGQIDEDTSHNPFLAYSGDTPPTQFFGFKLDGETVRYNIAFPLPTPVNGDTSPDVYHLEYKIAYYVGNQPRCFELEIDNGNPTDTSTFSVEVSNRGVLSYGR